MRQAVLGGRTAGLRPSQRRRLEQLSHRRHPPEGLADPLTLQRLAEESRELELPLSLVIDGRGLCRLLWIGPLEQAGRPAEQLGGSPRRRGGACRLITCAGAGRGGPPPPGQQEGIVALDLEPELWLRYPWKAQPGGAWPAALWRPSTSSDLGWQCVASDGLGNLCEQGAAAIADAEADVPPPPARDSGAERVLLLTLGAGDGRRDQERLAELEGLVRSAGGRPVGVIEQRRSDAAPQTLWGEGKLREAALEARRLGASLVVTDRELTPVQGRNLERLLDLPVSDRSELILDIFAQRAASAAGRLQVELAQLRYRLPRLSGRGRSLSRQGGGIGTRGPGETQLEKDRRAIARRIERLQREVRRLGEHRARLRQGRRQITRLALVGYTNAGKSSLLNALARSAEGRGVLAENKLFATLDPTTRRVDLADPGGGPLRSLLVTDTVGFIRALPPQLIEAFRSTLEEALDADGLLLVVDLADPAWPEQLAAVREILTSLETHRPCLVIGNQIDRCPATELERARALEPQMLFVSATADLGLQNLRQTLRSWPPPPPGPAVPTSSA
ncbi:MAG: GTPase HflX [Cyanobacteriota bacterium]|nr:GTPase HflX [Cyanobacteriota bacterium]